MKLQGLMSRKGVNGYESKPLSAWRSIWSVCFVGVEIRSWDMSPVLEANRRPIYKHTFRLNLEVIQLFLPF